MGCSMLTLRRSLLLALAGSLLIAPVLIASVAFAQTRVHVQVRGGEANVVLTAESGGQRYTCRTQGGACDIEGVASGRYVATAEPIGEGRAPVPRPVMVAGSGSTVTVHLRLR